MARDASISMERSHISADTPVSIHQRSALSEGDKSRELDRSKGDSVSKKSTYDLFLIFLLYRETGLQQTTNKKKTKTCVNDKLTIKFRHKF